MIDCKRSQSTGGRRRAAIAAVLLAPLLALLAGCATPVPSDVTVFHQWPEQAPRTYRFSADEAQLASLEHASYRNVLRSELARIGFVESRSPRFELRFDHEVRPRVDRWVEYTSPYYFSPWFSFGTWGSHGGLAFSAPWPGWGWGAPYAVERQQAWFAYRLAIVMTDLAAAGERVYEANAITIGTTESIAPAMPYLARAVFADFPGRSGVTRRVEVPAEAFSQQDR